MTTKPIAVWCVWSPMGFFIGSTKAKRRSDSIAKFERRMILEGQISEWPHNYRRGYQCKRFILSEAEEKL